MKLRRLFGFGCVDSLLFTLKLKYDDIKFGRFIRYGKITSINRIESLSDLYKLAECVYQCTSGSQKGQQE